MKKYLIIFGALGLMAQSCSNSKLFHKKKIWAFELDKS